MKPRASRRLLSMNGLMTRATRSLLLRRRRRLGPVPLLLLVLDELLGELLELVRVRDHARVQRHELLHALRSPLVLLGAHEARERLHEPVPARTRLEPLHARTLQRLLDRLLLRRRAFPTLNRLRQGVARAAGHIERRARQNGTTRSGSDRKLRKLALSGEGGRSVRF